MNMTSARLRYALALGGIPLILGLVLDWCFQSGILANHLLEFQITLDSGMLALLSGLTVSGLTWAGQVLLWYWRRRGTRALTEAGKRHVNKHYRFVRRLEHEMKNPLAVLQVSLAGLDQQYHPGARERQAVRSAVARLQRLIRDLRKLADLEAFSLEREPVDLVELVREAIVAVQSTPAREERSMSLITSRIPWPPASVRGDRDLLMLAFYNLLDNASKFTRPGDAIEVRVHEDGPAVTVDIADNGPGIAEQDLPYIFEELYRGKNARHTEGNGLGLAVVKKIIACHGGRITVRSRLGRGTVFTVQLPQS